MLNSLRFIRNLHFIAKILWNDESVSALSMRNIVRVVPNEIFPPKILHDAQLSKLAIENEIVSSISSSYVKEILFFLLYSSKKLNSSKRL